MLSPGRVLLTSRALSCPHSWVVVGALCSTGSLFAFRKCEQELGAPKGCLIVITTAKNLCHSWFQPGFDGAV